MNFYSFHEFQLGLSCDLGALAWESAYFLRIHSTKAVPDTENLCQRFRHRYCTEVLSTHIKFLWIKTLFAYSNQDTKKLSLRHRYRAKKSPWSRLDTRGVMIPLFPGSQSVIGIAKRLRIQLWIQIRGWNHNTSIAVTNPLFLGSRSGIRIAISPKKSWNPTPEPDPGPES